METRESQLRRRIRKLSAQFGCDTDILGKVAVLFPSWEQRWFETACDRVAKRFAGAFPGFVGVKGGQEITFVKTGLGSSLAGDATIALGATPVEVVFLGGAAGSLSERLTAGNILVVTDALVAEGFSRFFIEEGPERDAYGMIASPNPGLTRWCWEKVQEKCRLFGLTARKGRVCTVDSFAAETRRLLESYVARGCEAIDMEVSAFYTAAKTVGLKAVAILYVDDEPLSGRGRGSFDKGYLSTRRKRLEARDKLIHLITQLSYEYPA